MMINKEMYSCHIPKRRVVLDTTNETDQTVNIRQEVISSVFSVLDKSCYFRVRFIRIYANIYSLQDIGYTSFVLTNMFDNSIKNKERERWKYLWNSF
jgi:hypothetical protein